MLGKFSLFQNASVITSLTTNKVSFHVEAVLELVQFKPLWLCCQAAVKPSAVKPVSRRARGQHIFISALILIGYSIRAV